MLVQWFRSLLAPKTRPLTNGRRAAKRSGSFRPAVDALEGRDAPAIVGTLTLSGSSLVYTGTAANNIITVSETGGVLTINDAAGQINLNAAGFTGGGTSTVTGTIPGAVTSIIFNGGSGTDIINLGKMTTTANLQVVGEVININEAVTVGGFTANPGAGGLINLKADLSTNAKAVGGAANFMGNVVITGTPVINTDATTDGNVLFGGLVNGTGKLQINTAGLTGAANSGGNVTFNNLVNVSGGIQIGGGGLAGANNLTFHKAVVSGGAVDAGAFNDVRLNAGLTAAGDVTFEANMDKLGAQGFAQTAGDIVTTGNVITILADAGGSGSVTVRGLTTAVGGTVNLAAKGAIVDGNGLNMLNANTGAGGSVFAAAGNGGVSLDTQTSNLEANVMGLTASQTGHISIRNVGLDLTVTAGGVTTTKGNISLSNNINKSITLVGDVSTLNGDVTITTDGGGTATAGSIVGSGGVLTANKATLTARDAIDSLETNINSLFATTTLGKIDVTNSKTLNVLAANSANDEVLLETKGATSDLRVNGSVSAANGVTFTTERDFDLNSGSVTAGGLVLIDAGRSLRFASGTALTADGLKTLGTKQDGLLDISGTITAGAQGVVIGRSLNETTASISGKIFSGDAIDIDLGGTNATTVSVGGTLAAAAEIDINGGGLISAIFSSTSSVAAGTAFALSNGVDFTVILGGKVVSNVVSLSSGDSFNLHISGPVTASGAFLVATGGDSLTMNQTGAIMADTVLILSGNDTNFVSLAGPITATQAVTGTINVILFGATSNFLSITGTMSAADSTGVLAVGTGTNSVIATPSPFSEFEYFFVGGGASTLVINTAITNITSAPAAGGLITFTGSSGFLNWNTVGPVTVTPSVP